MGSDLSRRLQPAQGTTAIVFVGAVSTAAFLFPDKLDTGIPHLFSFIHLATISTWFGIQFWVTFVAGLTKMKLLPRHYFGLVQSHLFPKAFLYGIGLTTAALGTFARQNPVSSWKSIEKFQVLTLCTNLVATLINYFAIEPRMQHHMLQEHKFEKEYGHGNEIGPITDALLLENPQYMEMRKKFFIYHGISTTLNLLAFVSTGIYFWFLSKKIQI